MQDEELSLILKRLNRKVERLGWAMEKMNLAEYVEFFEHPRKLLVMNFLAGIFRGMGIAVGFTILTALVLYILNQLVMLNLPILGKFIADLIRVIEIYR